ncbi:hypothetical protein JXI42_07100 [bacterium]|nr:hypothetical protein [bacterium]
MHILTHNEYDKGRWKE